MVKVVSLIIRGSLVPIASTRTVPSPTTNNRSCRCFSKVSRTESFHKIDLCVLPPSVEHWHSSAPPSLNADRIISFNENAKGRRRLVPRVIHFSQGFKNNCFVSSARSKCTAGRERKRRCSCSVVRVSVTIQRIEHEYRSGYSFDPPLPWGEKRFARVCSCIVQANEQYRA